MWNPRLAQAKSNLPSFERMHLLLGRSSAGEAGQCVLSTAAFQLSDLLLSTCYMSVA